MTGRERSAPRPNGAGDLRERARSLVPQAWREALHLLRARAAAGMAPDGYFVPYKYVDAVPGYFEVLFPANYATRAHRRLIQERLGRRFPLLGLSGPGSIWLRRASGPDGGRGGRP
jgi:hypothetical protein